MNILIVEDDFFKFSKIDALVKEVLPDSNITKFDNVHDTVLFLKSNSPDKIILDMSLPSHSAKVGEGSPLPMPSGGIEIILELRSLGKANMPIIVLTQYHEIEIENEYYSISESEVEIKEIFGISNLSVVLYNNDSDGWHDETTKFLKV